MIEIRTRPAPRRSCRSTTAARTGCSRRTPTTRRSSAASARRASRARSAPRRPAPPTRRCTARCRRHLRGLRPRPADRAVGRQPLRVRHPPRAVSQAKPRSAGATLVVDRSARDLARAAGGSAPCAAAGHRPAGRAGAAPVSVRSTVSPTSAFLAEHTRGADAASRARAASGRSNARPTEAGIDAVGARHVRRDVRDGVARAGPLRLGPRAQPQRRQRGGGDPGAARGRRQVRRARRRLLDEQLGGAGASRPPRG